MSHSNRATATSHSFLFSLFLLFLLGQQSFAYPYPQQNTTVFLGNVSIVSDLEINALSAEFSATTAWSGYLYVYIDYNQDYEFNESNELVIIKQPVSSTPATFKIIPPSTALPGETTLRIIATDYASGITDVSTVPPGGNYQYEDHLVTLTSGNQIAPSGITTTPVTAITGTSAESGGAITNDGGAPISARGVCWNSTGNPTITDFSTNNGTGGGSYTSLLAQLTPGTTYYVRAFATNSAGTGYGNEITFATPVIINNKPVIHSVTPWIMEEGVPAHVSMSQIFAVDEDDDSLFVVLQSGSNYIENGDELLAEAGFTGTLTVAVAVSDGYNISETFPVEVEVRAAGVNSTPQLHAAAIPPIEKNSELRIVTDMVSTVDDDGDPLSIILLEGAEYTVQDATLIPQQGYTGTIDVQLQVTDGIDTSNALTVPVSVYEEFIGFYSGQVRRSENYRVAVYPNPVPAGESRVIVQAKNPASNRLDLVVYDEVGNKMHEGSTTSAEGNYLYSWDISEKESYRGKSYVAFLTYSHNNIVIHRDKQMIGVAR